MKNNDISEESLKILTDKIPSVPNTAFVPTVVPSAPLVDDFMGSSKVFWRKFENGKYTVSFDTGAIAGTYNTQRANIDSIFGFFIATLRKTAHSMSVSEDKKATDLDLYFKALETSEQLLRNKFDELFENDVDGLEMLSYIHGMINTFVNKNMKKDN